MNREVDIFHVGPQKTGTTWIYQCFREHPQISTSPRDSIHYYSMYHHRSRAWYLRQFETNDSSKKLFDPSYDYIRSPRCAERIVRENPNAKILIGLREPIERAFSHYWHEKKKLRFNFSFDEVLTNYDLYASWIEPGLCASAVKEFIELFGRERVKIVFFDNLETEPQWLLRELFEFVEVDSNFRPSVIDKKVNPATPIQTSRWKSYRKLASCAKKMGLYKPGKFVRDAMNLGIGLNEGGKGIEHLSDVADPAIRELRENVRGGVHELEALVGVDLSYWIDRYSHV